MRICPMCGRQDTDCPSFTIFAFEYIAQGMSINNAIDKAHVDLTRALFSNSTCVGLTERKCDA